MAKIFISYSRKDKDFAYRLAEDLAQSGADIWIDKTRIRRGDDWRKKIQQGLNASVLMLLIISPDSVESKNVTEEWVYFQEQDKTIIPVIYRLANRPIGISQLDYISFLSKDYETGFHELLDALFSYDVLDPLYSQICSLATEYSNGNEIALDTAKHLLLDCFRVQLSLGGYLETDKIKKRLINFVTKDLASRHAGDKLLAKVRVWLEDELILVYPKSDAYISDIKKRLSGSFPSKFALVDLQTIPDTPLDTEIDTPLYFDIEFKSEYIKRSNVYKEGFVASAHDPISLVAQCMFVICHQNGVFYTLHDRSYSGAEDKMSKYAMITGRLSAKDLAGTVGNTMVKPICQATLFRELQELDELGLSANLATKYTNDNQIKRGLPRTQFVGVYESQGGKVLSFLFAIFVTVDEYDSDLTKRGPYLIPVSPTEYSNLRTLNLLNDILHRNSCSHCEGNGYGQFACSFGRENQDTCIIRDIRERITDQTLTQFDAYDDFSDRDHNIAKYRTRLGCDSVIVAIDIPDYSLLNVQMIQEVSTNLKQHIKMYFNGFADSPTDHYSLLIQPTSKGYIVVLKSNRSEEDHNLALIGYFFSLYLSMNLTNDSLWQEKDQQSPFPDVRIGLHMDNPKPIYGKTDIYFPSDGINRALDIVSIGQPRQILCSQSFIIHLLDDIKHHGTEVIYTDGVLRDKHIAQGLWNANRLAKTLKNLGLILPINREIVQNESISNCFEEHGLPISDLGFFTQDNGLRYRVFNLGIFHLATGDKSLPSYGNEEQPTARIPIIYRTKNTTNDELQKLVESLRYAEHLMMYGFSNVRMMREIKKKYITDEKSHLHLKTFKVIFYDFAQYKELNETRDIKITQANWIRGFLYAQQIAETLRKTGAECKIAVNSVRYGFNVFRVIYATDAPDENKDSIRFTVPMPGRAFELSPVFIINRGDPLYHRFLEICDKYVEEGIKENSDHLSVTEYVPNNQGRKILEQVFIDSPSDIDGVSEEKYRSLIEDMSNDKTATIAAARNLLGEHAVDLLAENDFTEAYRLRTCLQILEKYSTKVFFDYDKFLRNFLV